MDGSLVGSQRFAFLRGEPGYSLRAGVLGAMHLLRITTNGLDGVVIA